MGLPDRDYYGEKYWKLIEEEDKRPQWPGKEFFKTEKNFDFRKIFSTFSYFGTILSALSFIIFIVWLVIFAVNRFTSPKLQKSGILKAPEGVLEIKIYEVDEYRNWICEFEREKTQCIRINIGIKNKGHESVEITYFDFNLIDSNQLSYGPYLPFDLPLPLEKMVVLPGNEGRGNLVFKIPKDASGLVLRFSKFGYKEALLPLGR